MPLLPPSYWISCCCKLPPLLIEFLALLLKLLALLFKLLAQLHVFLQQLAERARVVVVHNSSQGCHCSSVHGERKSETRKSAFASFDITQQWYSGPMNAHVTALSLFWHFAVRETHNQPYRQSLQ